MPSLSAVSHIRPWVKVFQWFTSVQKLSDRLREESLSCFSQTSLPSSFYSCTPPSPPPPPVHSSLYLHSLSFLPANFSLYHSNYFCTSQPAVLVPEFAFLRSWSRSKVSRDLQDVQKTPVTHPAAPAGWCRSTGDFTALMTGHSLPSWTHINLSVGWFLQSNIKVVPHHLMLSKGLKAVVDLNGMI